MGRQLARPLKDRWWGSSGHTVHSEESFARIRPLLQLRSKHCSSGRLLSGPQNWTNTPTEGRRASFTRSFNHLLFHRPQCLCRIYIYYQAAAAAALSHRVPWIFEFSSVQLTSAIKHAVYRNTSWKSVPKISPLIGFIQSVSTIRWRTWNMHHSFTLKAFLCVTITKNYKTNKNETFVWQN